MDYETEIRLLQAENVSLRLKCEKLELAINTAHKHVVDGNKKLDELIELLRTAQQERRRINLN